jgi:hypothetical protein
MTRKARICSNIYSLNRAQYVSTNANILGLDNIYVHGQPPKQRFFVTSRHYEAPCFDPPPRRLREHGPPYRAHADFQAYAADIGPTAHAFPPSSADRSLCRRLCALAHTQALAFQLSSDEQNGNPSLVAVFSRQTSSDGSSDGCCLSTWKELEK